MYLCRATLFAGWVGVGARQAREEMKHSARLRASHLHAHVDSYLILGRGHLDPEG